MLIIGTLSIILALNVQSIIQSLLIALTIFSGAFIVPTAAGLFGFRTSKVRSGVAMIAGGTIALAGKVIVLNGENIFGNLLIIIGFILNALILFTGSLPKLSTKQEKINLTSQ